MLVDLSPVSYLALCGLVKDALEVESDASVVLRRAAKELAKVNAGGMISSELMENPGHIESLRQAGFIEG